LEDTGRIQHGLTPSARRILFAGHGAGPAPELPWIARIDKAHLVMLAERGLVTRAAAAGLLAAIANLERADFAPLAGRPAPRGVYLLYEDYLIETAGAETGGILQTGRSRNDLNATLLRLRLRAPYLRLAREVLRLQAVLLARAARHAATVMPIYTHYQAALPITFGHYLAGVATALERDLGALLALAPPLDHCPLGAGAAAGTTLPLDTARTAGLLGFRQPVGHSLDAVASRDLVLRLLAAAGVLGVTLSRLGSDLLLWSTEEFGFLTFPDRLVGSSSMMPQKRNPFLLEHVLGRSAAPLGAFISAAGAMHGAPFSNSIAVGTEAVEPVWGALRQITEAVILLRLMLAGAQARPAAMFAAAARSFTTATELANRLATQGGLPFRAAHHLVGRMVSAAIARGEPLERAAAGAFSPHPPPISLDQLDPAAVAAATAHGGGPAAASLAACLGGLRRSWVAGARALRRRRQAWSRADRRLDRTVRDFLRAGA
jgi:argininosuccinate lyase